MALVRVFEAVKNGKVLQIALSEAQVWHLLDSHWALEPSERHLWSVTSVERDVSVVEGTVVWFDRTWVEPDQRLIDETTEPIAHVRWSCPACGDEHFTDLNDGEPNPALWYCERGTKQMFLIQRQ